MPETPDFDKIARQIQERFSPANDERYSDDEDLAFIVEKLHLVSAAPSPTDFVSGVLERILDTPPTNADEARTQKFVSAITGFPVRK